MTRATAVRWARVRRWHQAREAGQGLVEYTLLVALISFVAIAAVTSLGDTIVTKLYTLAGSF